MNGYYLSIFYAASLLKWRAFSIYFSIFKTGATFFFKRVSKHASLNGCTLRLFLRSVT